MTQRLLRPRLGTTITSNDVVIYWGKPCNILINPKKEINKNNSRVIDKGKFFNHAKDKEWCVPFTKDKQDALKWKKIACRLTLTGSGGEGIKIVTNEDSVPDAKLYVKYIPKESEYRIHVCDGKIIKIQRKVMPAGSQPKNGWGVRSHDNGFIFQSVDLSTVPQVCQDAALDSIKHFELDFGGCDVIYNKASNKAYVLEINSAPGVENDTAVIYAKALIELALK
jgi:hypothetical protein